MALLSSDVPVGFFFLVLQTGNVPKENEEPPPRSLAAVTTLNSSCLCPVFVFPSRNIPGFRSCLDFNGIFGQCQLLGDFQGVLQAVIKGAELPGQRHQPVPPLGNRDAGG